MDRTERAAFLALNTIFGFEPAAGHRLLGEIGSACAVFELSGRELRDLLGVDSHLPMQIRQSDLYKAMDELDRIEDRGYSFVCYGEEGYPGLLLECPDAPLGLYLRSSSPATEIFREDRPKIAIVGTRDISHYGSEWCIRLVEALSRSAAKPLIVSGLALGTDITAQRTALEDGLPTVAVMATGVDRVYPPQHEWSAQEIASSPGSGLITDYPVGTAPKAVHFVRRNRIIAGICNALVLVESKIRGGGMISARLAASYDREVYAIPGRIDDRRSIGCNLLIRERTAEPVTDMDDFISQLGLGSPVSKTQSLNLGERVKKVFAGYTAANRLADTALMIKNHRGIGIGELSTRLCVGYGEASALVRMLESEGFIVTDLFGNCRINAKKG